VEKIKYTLYVCTYYIIEIHAGPQFVYFYLHLHIKSIDTIHTIKYCNSFKTVDHPTSEPASDHSERSELLLKIIAVKIIMLMFF